MAFRYISIHLKDATIVCMLAICFFCNGAYAQQKFMDGQGIESNKDAAIRKAKLSAWKNYLGTLQGAKLDNILDHEKVILEDLDSFMTSVNVISEKCDGGLFGSCVVNVKVTINESIIDSRLRRLNRAQTPSQGRDVARQAENIAFLAMARVAKVQVSYDPKETKRRESEVYQSDSSTSLSRSQGGSSSSDSLVDETSQKRGRSDTKGGSRENKQDKIAYVPWGNISDLQNRIGETLTNNRFSTVPWEDLVARCSVSDSSSFSKLYAQSETGQLPAAIREEIFRNLRERCRISKIIIAQIEIDGYRTEPGSGLFIATGNVNVQAFDLTGDFGRSVGSANRPLSGRAEQLLDASRNALANSAAAASDVIVNQFNLR